MRKTFFIVISLAIGLILGTSVLLADINTGLVSYWSFNDNLNDITGNGYDGEMINGTVSYIQGVKGKGIKLPGTTDSRIFLNPWIPGNSSLTISGWVKMLSQDEFWFNYQGPIYVSQVWDYSHGFYLRPIMRQGELHIEFGIEASNSTGNIKGDRHGGIPGPGFVGTYSLVFIEINKYGERSRKNFQVTIVPRFSRE